MQRLCRWAEELVAQLEQEKQQQQQQPLPLPPPPQSPLLVPTVAAVAFVLLLPVAAAAHVPVVPVHFDPTVLAQVAALKAGPRVGPSPATVQDV